MMFTRRCRSRATSLGLLLLCAAVNACSVGEGEGEVKSEKLYVEGCWNGLFNLRPDFFAASPYQDRSLMIRLQRGDNIEEQSDGLFVLVNELQALRKQLSDSMSDVTVKVGLPPGVSPPGVPLMANDDPPQVSLALYLHKSCHFENATIYSTSGDITFRSIFSGDLAETDAEDRLTDASFDATFADPRKLASASAADKASVESQVTGSFRFYFQRGQPAQPFQ